MNTVGNLILHSCFHFCEMGVIVLKLPSSQSDHED